MADAPTPGAEHRRRGPSKLRAAGLTVIIFILVMLYVTASNALGIENLYGAFLFSIYFMALKRSNLREFLPSVLGSAFGIAVAMLLSQIPLLFSPPVAVALGMLVTLATIFGLVAQIAPLFMNLAQVIFLTVCTIPRLNAFDEQVGVALSLAFGATIIGAGTVLYHYFRRFNRRGSAIPAVA